MGLLELEWIVVPNRSSLIGRSATDLDDEVIVVGVMRDGVFTTHPQPTDLFQAGDSLAVVGTLEQIDRIEQRIKPDNA